MEFNTFFFPDGYLDKYIKTLKKYHATAETGICIFSNLHKYIHPTTQSITVILENNLDNHRDIGKGKKKRKKTEGKPLATVKHL